MSKIIPMPVIEASGSSYEIGFAHGSQARAEVLCSIKTYQAMFLSYANLKWEDAKRKSVSYVPYINQFDPDLMNEIQGVADGAGVEMEDILALNARSEVVMTTSGVPGALADGCTAFSVTGDGVREGHVLLAQNWDWKGTQIDSLAVLKIKQSGGKPDITMVTEAGIIGKIGCNSAGLGVCLNALATPVQPEGVPLHIVLRGILNSVKISDAIGRVNARRHACAANYLIAHKNGASVDIEKTPDEFEVILPENNLLVHTNHMVSPRLHRINDTSRLLLPDSYVRLHRAKTLLQKRNGKIDVEYCKEVLKDHMEYPDAICRHDDPLDVPGLRACTVFSLIANLSAGEIWLAKGMPCQSEYHLI